MAKPQTEDFLAHLLQMGLDLKLDLIQKAVNQHIPTLEGRMGKKINEHLGWYGGLQGVKYSDKPEEHGWSKGDKYFGEWSEAT